MVRFLRSWWIWLIGLAVVVAHGAKAGAESATTVFLNGVPTPVYFNDGDSFRVLAGPMRDTKARLAGFNTLESYGPTHSWGRWHRREMYAIAKMATYNAARGVWHCESKDMRRDGYGRILWFCLDLAKDQVRHGFAHAMTVDDDPGHPDVLAAQREAQRERRGMWAHGIPTYVLTSIHSAAEGFGDKTYNRLASTVDGRSQKWHHESSFRECQQVCHRPTELPLAEALKVATELRADARVAKVIAGVDDELIARVVNTFLQIREVPMIFDDLGRQSLTQHLERLKSQGRFRSAAPRQGSCMLYVEFKRWYSQPKPECLKW
jgi:endonuclease YncB( thermonuclease family)